MVVLLYVAYGLVSTICTRGHCLACSVYTRHWRLRRLGVLLGAEDVLPATHASELMEAGERRVCRCARHRVRHVGGVHWMDLLGNTLVSSSAVTGSQSVS